MGELLAGGGMGIAGALLQNQLNQQSVAQQEGFQQSMSDTAYQRQTRDMIAAGLNPMFAMGSGGASTPAGSVAQMQDPISGGLTGAKNAVDVMNAQKSQSNQNASTVANVGKTMADTAVSKAQAEKTMTETAALKGEAAKSGIMSDALSTIAPTVKKAADWLKSPTLYNGMKNTYDSIKGSLFQNNTLRKP